MMAVPFKGIPEKLDTMIALIREAWCREIWPGAPTPLPEKGKSLSLSVIYRAFCRMICSWWQSGFQLHVLIRQAITLRDYIQAIHKGCACLHSVSQLCILIAQLEMFSSARAVNFCLIVRSGVLAPHLSQRNQGHVHQDIGCCDNFICPSAFTPTLSSLFSC